MSVEVLLQVLRVVGGIGLFLFGLYLQEEAMKASSGRPFKLFLQRVTRSSLGAIAGGFVVTSILQSSSIVSLMVLAFVGARIITMKNAIGIILGANLGSTVYSWIVATVGFKLSIEYIAYPAVGIGGFLLVLYSNRSLIRNTSFFLLGFGLLFIGLSFMRTAIEAQRFDLGAISHVSPAFFLLIGFAITVVVQSSSVTIALALSALHAGSIDFQTAAAVAIGSETGTTIKILLGSVGGNAVKKRVALGNFLFNVLSSALAFTFLTPILQFITNVIGVRDPLIGLVTFSSICNLGGILLFLPVLNAFSAMLERLFRDDNGGVSAFIRHGSVNEPQTALDLFRKETGHFIYNAMRYILSLFELNASALPEHPDYVGLKEHKTLSSGNKDEMYEHLKQLQGELQAFYITFRSKLQGKQGARLDQLNAAARSAMHAVKSIKDVRSNISNFRRSSKNVKFDFFLHHQEEIQALLPQLNTLLRKPSQEVARELPGIYQEVRSSYDESLHAFYNAAQASLIDEMEIATAINLNREILASKMGMLIAIRDLLLENDEHMPLNSFSSDAWWPQDLR